MEKYLYFDKGNIEEIVEWGQAWKRKTKVYVANSIYFFSHLLKFVKKTGATASVINHGSDIYKVQVGAWVFTSVDYIFRAPFITLCSELGLGEPSNEAVEKLVNIIEENAEGFSFKNGDFLTVGSLAWKLINSFDDNETFDITQDYPMNWETWGWWKSHGIYKGGLCIVNERYKGKNLNDLYKYDKNSFFGWVMKYGNMPRGRFCKNHGKPNKLKDKLIHAKISGKSKFEGIGAYEDKSLFLAQDIYIWGDELEELFHWYDLDIEWIEYWEWALNIPDPHMGAFVDYFYDKKLHATGMQRRFAKLMLNNGYGKWGQNPVNQHIRIKDGKESLGNTGVNYKSIRSLAVASKITALARTELMRSIREATHGRPDLYYVYGDTDSMILTIPFDKVGDQLGEFKFEGYFNKGKVLGKKCYMLYDGKYECHAAGIPRYIMEGFFKDKNWDEAQEYFEYGVEWNCPCIVTIDGIKKLEHRWRQLSVGQINTFNSVYGFYEGE